LDAVAQLLKAAYQQYAGVLRGRWTRYLEDIEDVRSRWEDSQQIVAEENGRLAGAVNLWLKKGQTSREEWPADWAGVRLLAVHPDFRGRGIGRFLMDECVCRCRQAGVKTLALHTTEFMEVGRRMYERMGFVRVPEYDYHPTPDVNIMAYKLDL
jgi:GNAT superfamily N-acetyltransferase